MTPRPKQVFASQGTKLQPFFRGNIAPGDRAVASMGNIHRMTGQEETFNHPTGSGPIFAPCRNEYARGARAAEGFERTASLLRSELGRADRKRGLRAVQPKLIRGKNVGDLTTQRILPRSIDELRSKSRAKVCFEARQAAPATSLVGHRRSDITDDIRGQRLPVAGGRIATGGGACALATQVRRPDMDRDSLRYTRRDTVATRAHPASAATHVSHGMDVSGERAPVRRQQLRYDTRQAAAAAAAPKVRRETDSSAKHAPGPSGATRLRYP